MVHDRCVSPWDRVKPSPAELPIFFFYLVCEAIGTAATPGLMCQPRVIVKMIMEKQMECRLAGETEVLGENLSQRHFCSSQNLTWPDPGLNPDHRCGNCLSLPNQTSENAAQSGLFDFGALQLYNIECCSGRWILNFRGFWRKFLWPRLQGRPEPYH
jgi:hypothetical protein